MEDCLYYETAPKMIFVPDRPLIRMIINLVVKKDDVENEDKFLLRFGLLTNHKEKLKDVKKQPPTSCTP